MSPIASARSSTARPSASRSLRVLATWVPLWLGPVLVIGLLFGWDDVYARLAVFFSKMAVVTFGGAYAVLSYVAQQAVEGYGWLSPAVPVHAVTETRLLPAKIRLFINFLAARLAKEKNE